jgi:hypothetical protein
MRTERLVALCKLWGTVEYFHPYLAYRTSDWDGALVTAIADVSAAGESAAFAAAVEAMVATLGDRATRVIAQDAVEAEPRLPNHRLTDDHILVSYDAQFSIAAAA